MPLLTPDECIVQCRAEPEDGPLLESLLASAESAVAGHLNRAVFSSDEELANALDALPGAACDAQEAYEGAVARASLLGNAAAREMAIAVARERLAEAKLRFDRVLHGMVVTPRVVAAIRLTLGNLYANREQVVVGATAVELPQGISELLRSDRRTLTP